MSSVQESNLKPENILLIMNQKENQRLIKDLLNQEYNLKTYEEIDNLALDAEPDLIIIDPKTFLRLKSKITSIKEKEKPTYLPIMILVSKNNQEMLSRKNALLNEYIIDDLVEIPLPKLDFLSRVKNLLHTRELSLLAEKNYYTLAGESPVGICILQDNKIKYTNKAFSIITGKPKEQIIDSDILDYIADDDREKIKIFINKGIEKDSLEIKFNHSKWIEVRFSEIIYKGQVSKLLIISDITARKETEEQIKYLSFNDKLTGLYNRAYFEEEVERLNTKRQLPLSIILGDVNGLKLTNDAFGHSKGNELLKNISKKLKAAFRQEDIIARLGGDEFGILLPGTTGKEADLIIQRINNNCKEDLNSPINLSIALGAATKNNIDQDIDEVFNQAEDRMYRNKIAESKSTRNSIFNSLQNTLFEKTHETEEHSKRMENLIIQFHQYLDLPDYILDELKLLARLHDIGKVAINESILMKTGQLSKEEYEAVKRHSEIGYNIVKEMPSMAHVSNGILTHHERWDGDGYPQGLKGKEIPLISRIINIVDSYDVMTNERIYKEAISKEEAIQEIADCSGKQFDPDLAGQFIEMMNN